MTERSPFLSAGWGDTRRAVCLSPITTGPACQGSRWEPELGSDRPHLGNAGLREQETATKKPQGSPLRRHHFPPLPWVIVSSLDLNPGLQRGRGFSRFFLFID